MAQCEVSREYPVMSVLANRLDRNLKLRSATRCVHHPGWLSSVLRAPIARFPRGRRSGRALFAPGELSRAIPPNGLVALQFPLPGDVVWLPLTASSQCLQGAALGH
jgi:hypothetical protein